MTKLIEAEVATAAKLELPELCVTMNPRGQYFIALAGTQTPFDPDMSIYTEEKTAHSALHTLKENW
jgi:hypothetical protein